MGAGLGSQRGHLWACPREPTRPSPRRPDGHRQMGRTSQRIEAAQSTFLYEQFPIARIAASFGYKKPPKKRKTKRIGYHKPEHYIADDTSATQIITENRIGANHQCSIWQHGGDSTEVVTDMGNPLIEATSSSIVRTPYIIKRCTKLYHNKKERVQKGLG